MNSGRFFDVISVFIFTGIIQNRERNHIEHGARGNGAEHKRLMTDRRLSENVAPSLTSSSGQKPAPGMEKGPGLREALTRSNSLPRKSPVAGQGSL